MCERQRWRDKETLCGWMLCVWGYLRRPGSIGIQKLKLQTAVSPWMCGCWEQNLGLLEDHQVSHITSF